ncbi:hypothetical protein GF360_02875 [candidate division WWE3 bacterium]|nr:hypothetical protein [candidate division WWE3 bacterium]
MTLDQISLIFNIVQATLLGVLFIYLKFNIEKRLKKHEYFVTDLGELNNKMHDRLVHFEKHIRKQKPISPTLRERLLMNSSRLTKYDKQIPKLVADLLDLWDSAFDKDSITCVDEATLSTIRGKSLKLTSKIKDRVDSLVV